MLIILSPAKTMDMKTLGDTYPFTWPLFQQDADLLVGKMQQYGVEELQKLLKVSKISGRGKLQPLSKIRSGGHANETSPFCL